MNLVKQNFKTKKELKKFLLAKHWNTYKNFMDSNKLTNKNLVLNLFEDMNDLLNSVKKDFRTTVINFFMALINDLSTNNINIESKEFDNRTENLGKLEQRLKHQFGYSIINTFRIDLLEFWSGKIDENTLINKRSW